MIYKESAEQHGANSQDIARYIPWNVGIKMRVLQRPLRINGRLRTRYSAPLMKEYVDFQTGEILSMAQVRARGVPQEAHHSERFLLREAVLATLRPEVRRFALFVLAFRNQRRGITPGIDTLVPWYARYANKRIDNVRRYVPRLYEAGVLAGKALAGELFQVAGKRTSARDHLGEECRAISRYAALIHSATAPTFTEKPQWLHEREAERAAFLKTTLDRIRPRLGKGSSSCESYECKREDEEYEEECSL